MPPNQSTLTFFYFPVEEEEVVVMLKLHSFKTLSFFSVFITLIYIDPLQPLSSVKTTCDTTEESKTR